jgi:Sec-independent protein translocase protein TatA
MKQAAELARYLPNILSGFMPQLARRMERKRNQRVKLRYGGIANINRRRRNNNRRRRNNFEINQADGGLKQNYGRQQTRMVPVNLFGRIVAIRQTDGFAYRFQLLSENYNFSYDDLDLMSYLNTSTEFNTWRELAMQYKVKGINTTINYNYHANSGDYVPRLLLMYNTDVVRSEDLKFESNVMNLDLSKVGTKNYNIFLNNKNMFKSSIEWQLASQTYPSYVHLKIGQQDTTYLTGDIQFAILGTVKITINVLFRLNDLPSAISKANMKIKNIKRFNEVEVELDEIEREEMEEKIKEEGIQSESQLEDKSVQADFAVEFKKYHFVDDAMAVYLDSKDDKIKTTAYDMYKLMNDHISAFISQLFQITKFFSYNEDTMDSKIVNKQEFDYFKYEGSLGGKKYSFEDAARYIQCRIMLHMSCNSKLYFWNENDYLQINAIKHRIIENFSHQNIPMSTEIFLSNYKNAKKRLEKKKNKNKNKNKVKKKNQNDALPDIDEDYPE